MCSRNIWLVGTTLSCEIRYLEAEETFLQSHKTEEFVGIKWKPTQLSITGSSKGAVRQHRSDFRRTEYRAIRKVSKVEQHRSSPYLQINILSWKHIKPNNWNTYPAHSQCHSILVAATKPVRNDGTGQNLYIRRSPTTKEIYNRAKPVLQATQNLRLFLVYDWNFYVEISQALGFIFQRSKEK